jgi:hypothetical protein
MLARVLCQCRPRRIADACADLRDMPKLAPLHNEAAAKVWFSYGKEETASGRGPFGSSGVSPSSRRKRAVVRHATQRDSDRSLTASSMAANPASVLPRMLSLPKHGLMLTAPIRLMAKASLRLWAFLCKS